MSPAADSPTNDSLVGRWRRGRDRNPSAPLIQILGQLASTLPDQLIDVACMDLIEQHRAGNQIGAEAYLEQYPSLDTPSHRLDLIDAEMCVREETDDRLPLEPWLKRFPADHAAIRALAQIDQGVVADQSTGTQTSVADRSDDAASAAAPYDADATLVSESIDAMDFSVDPSPAADSFLSDCPSFLDPHSTPDWFIGQRIVASGPGWWIVRGNHRDTQAAFALKVIALPPTVTPSQIRRLHEVVAESTQIQHPVWQCGESSTIFNGHLGVLRPWIHGVAWTQWESPHTESHPHDKSRPSERLRQLATIAMMVHSAIQAGCHHGGIHAGNLWVDHQGNLRCVDGGASRCGMARWLTGGMGEFMTREERARVDREDLRSLIASTVVRMDGSAPDAVIPWLRSPELSAAELAEILLDAADGKPSSRRSNRMRGRGDQRSSPNAFSRFFRFALRSQHRQ